MQSSYSNQFLRKLTIHRYNKLSFCQVRRTYKLSQYHFKSIIKQQSLGNSTSISDTSFSSLISLYKIFLCKTHAFL